MMIGLMMSLGNPALSARSPYGPNLTRNSGFDTDTEWSKGAGWVISGGLASRAVASATGVDITQTGTGMVAARQYLFAVDLTLTSGTFQFAVFDGAGGTSPLASASGPVSWIYTALRTNDPIVARASSTFTGSIDNFTIREVL